MFISGNNSSRGNAMLSSDLPLLSQCLPLEPITLDYLKYSRSGELRRVLGLTLGSTAEQAFGVAHFKPPTPVATEDIRHFRENVIDASRKARDRTKKLSEYIFKLDKYREALGSRKRQRTDHLSNERSGVANMSKMGSQLHGNPVDIATQRSEDRAKIIGLNKRVRTSMADPRADSRPVSISRQQIVMEKDKDTVSGAGDVSVPIVEKIRRLPAGGEGWDKKMKKKRSVGSVINRVINGDRDAKRSMNLKTGADCKMRSSDVHGFRSKSSPEVSGNTRLDDSLELASSSASAVLRNDLESGLPLKDRMTTLEQRVVAKGNNKKNIYVDTPAGNPSIMIKGKASRAPRSGSLMAVDCLPDVHLSSGALEGWDQLSNVNKVSALGLSNNHKRPLSTNSSSHPIAQWSGQRPQKISRTRRANLVSPISNHAEAQSSSKGFVNTDISAKITSTGASGSVLTNGLDNNVPISKVEPESVPSSIGFTESEESGARENGMREKGTDSDGIARNAVHKVPTRKNKMLIKEEIGGGVQRQGRNGGRSLVLTRADILPLREKLENLPTMKPFHTRPGSDKNKSKSGRPPPKKLTDRKTTTRAGQLQNNGSPDCTGESDDDHQELLAAANSARNASKLACSSSFWKKMEYIFASVSSEDASYLKQQLHFTEERSESLSQMFGHEYNVLVDPMRKEIPLYSGERQGSQSNPVKTDAPRATFDMRRKSDKVTPLYQRVLSALIEEDESEELYNHDEAKNTSSQYASDDSHCGSCNHIDVEPKDGDRMESEVESEVDFLTPGNCSMDRYSCDRSGASNPSRNPSMCNSVHNNERWQGDESLSHSDVRFVNGTYQNGLDGLQSKQISSSGISSFDCQYQLMSLDDRLLLELHSVGLYPEALPDLAEGGEVINQDIVELKEGLYQQVGKKKNKLVKIDKAIQDGKDAERRDIEQVAINQLIEVAYRKRMVIRGTAASKSVVRKVQIQAALAFIKRTLSRCQKFENTGRSCFRGPAFEDIIFSTPPCSTGAKSVDCVGSGTASNTYNEAKGSAGGADSRTLERHDSYSNNNLEPAGKKKEMILETKAEVKVKFDKEEEEEEAIDFSSFPLPEFESIEELGAPNAAGEEHPDLTSWLNFDDDALQEHDSMGLEIPMDNLAELNIPI